ncbi:MAG: lipid-A-disaccharide synthase [Cyanobacteria bacterium]|nr:lipid-A-disaccharide synthase [Cyanobacteriota bacterium]
MKKRIFISTGEVSGDLQGSMLVTALLKKARLDGIDLEIVALGGDRMEAAGAHLLGNTIALSSIGLLEAVPYILPTLKMQRYAKQQLRENPPDLVILIDYIGANLGMGQFIRSQFPNCPIVYYIAPQEWVWSMNDKNTNEIVSITDRLLAIFPEEARYYKNQGASVTWVGHPLVDRLASAPSREVARKSLGIPPEEQAIVLSPASRKQELKFLMPTIFEAARAIQDQVPNAKFYIPLALDRYREAIKSAVQSYGLNAKLISREDTQMAIAAADLAITKSGTVNLELALLNIPQVAIYRISRFTAWAGRNILKVKITFASPVNLVLMRTVVPELLQEEANVDRIVKESIALLFGPAREKVLQDYQEVQKGLGAIGVCDRAAIEIFALLC